MEYIAGGRARWSTQTSGNPGAHAIMQSSSPTATSSCTRRRGPLWSSGTSGHPGASAFLQDDGNLVVYSLAMAALWNTGTNGHGGDTAWVQTDGNLVVYSPAMAALWSAGTGGRTISGSVAPKPPPAGRCPPRPPPPPPPPAPAPVVTTPLTTPLPAAPRPHALTVRGALSWTWNRGITRLRAVRIGSFPRRTHVLVSCRGRAARAALG